MERTFLFSALIACALSVSAQNDYIVKTRNVKKMVVVKENEEKSDSTSEVKEEDVPEHNFVNDNFHFYSMCDWADGMRFMVIPEKKDLVMNTFVDAETDKEVPSMRLRHKIMVYKGHSEAANGRSRVDFVCEDDGKKYYYEIPSGTFENHCFGKLGVPTLAYLGDVDIAREKLLGQQVFTTADIYRIDTDIQSDEYEEVNVSKNTACQVTAIGVGTRSFPVKIVVMGPDGKEFYQNVAMSRTNSGMRDNEFIMDNARYTFFGSFDLADANLAVESKHSDLIGSTVYTKYATTMVSPNSDKVKISRLSEFKVTAVSGTKNGYVTLTLQGLSSGKTYTKDVTFNNVSVIGDIDGQREDYFDYLFAKGNLKGLKSLSKEKRRMIQLGKVAIGFTPQEVRWAKGTPNKVAKSTNGRFDWIWEDGTIVKFSKTKKVFKIDSY